MTKKKSKQQPKPNEAKLDDAATVSTASVTTTSQPANASRDDALTFLTFIANTTAQDIREFLKLAATKPEGGNLMYLWERAYEDGYVKGKKSLLQNLEGKLGEKFEEGLKRGMDLGREEGYTIAKEGFD